MSKKGKAYQKATAIGKSFFSSNTWKPAFKTDKSDWYQTVAKSFVDLGAGFAGAAGGSFLGWAALPFGLAGNVWANKTGHSWARAMSIGMMTAPVDEAIGANRQAAGGGFDLKAEVAEGSERAKNYFGQVYRKFGLHKVFGTQSPTPTDPATEAVLNGLGTVTFDALDKYEQQIVSSGIEHEGGMPSSRQFATAVAQNSVPEAFSVNGLDDLNTPHIL